jgi:hypothetical protein
MAALSEVGSCNTRLPLKTERPEIGVHEWGIDTWRIARYFDNDDDLRRVVRLTSGRTHQKVCDHAIGVLPDRRMLWMEGHPAVDGLAHPKTLSSAEGRVLSGLDDLGLPRGRDGGIRRLDQTVTLRFDEAAEGIAYMRGMAAVQLPRVKKSVYHANDGYPETVNLIGAGRRGRILARCYDKGVESGAAQRGELIRLENQTRYRKDVAEYITPESVSEHHHLAGSHFGLRFAPVAESVDGIHVATAPVLADRVTELVQEGDMSPAKGARLVGYLVCGDRLGLADSTRRRWRSELRHHGLVLVDPLGDDIDVDLGEPLNRALAAWSEDAAA